MMKKLLLFWFPVILYWTVNAQNIVPNGGLETWTSDTQPESWTTADNASKEATTIHSGTYSAKITSGSSTLKFNQSIPVIGGKTYTISYWYLDNDVNAKTRMWSAWLNGTTALTDNLDVFQPSTYSSDNAAWQQFTTTLTAPAPATAFRFEVRNYKGTTEGGFIYLDDFSMLEAGASTAADILSFEINGQIGNSVIDAMNHSVIFTMPTGADVTALTPSITISTGASISPASGIIQNFTQPVNYTVTAEDGTTEIEWTASVEFSSEITLFHENFETVTANADIALEGWVNYKETGSKAWIGKSYSSNFYAQMSSFGSGEANEAWLITPTIDLSETIDEVFSFNVNVGYYTHTGFTVLISENFDGTNVAAATWTDITSSFAIPTTPTSGYGTLALAGEYDLSAYTSNVNVAFKYTGDANATQTTTYQVDEVKVIGKEPIVLSSETDILSFTFTEQSNPATIDKELKTVSIEVVNGTSLTALTPTISVSEGAVINPASGIAQDFSEAFVYTVTAEDGTTIADWTINVSVAVLLSDKAEITTFSLTEEIEEALINTDAATVTSLVKWDTDLTSLSPSITVSVGAQITPTTSQDFSVPVKYFVTAQNGTTVKEWTVTVSKANEPSHLAEITGFELSQLTTSAVINTENATITGELVSGTVLTNLLPTITISEGAVISPVGAQDFTNTVNYTVTAEDGTTQKIWMVTLTVKEADLIKIYDIQYSEDATGVTPMLNQTVKTQGIVTGKDSKGIFIQDGDGAWNGINVYKGSAIEANVGDLVTVEGTVIEYQNLTEIGTPTVTVVSSGNSLPNPVEVSLSEFKQEKYEGVLVQVSNVTCSDTANTNGNWQVIDLSDVKIIVRNQLYIYKPVVGEFFASITGIGTQYKTDYQLLPRSMDDIILTEEDVDVVLPSLYPNPLKNTLTFENIEQVSTIVISNILGQNVWIANNNQMNRVVDLSSLNKGIYLVTFQFNNGESQTQKIIKE